jgi:hypothetical protein
MAAMSARLEGWRTRVLPDADASRSAAPLASVIAALVVAATVAVSLRGGPAVGAGEARLVLNGARVNIALAGHAFTPATGSPTLHTGDRVRVVEGEPQLQLVKDAHADLRAGSAVRMGTADGPQLTLENGDLLATGPLTVGTIEATTQVLGVAKLVERSGLLAGVYKGTARVQTPDAPTATVHQYRQLAALGLGSALGTFDPLHVDDSDRWDRRYLGEVIDLDGRLDSFARGFDAQLPAGSGTTPGFYRTLVPGLENEDLPANVLEGRSAGENLIGFTMVALDSGPLKTRVDRIFGFRDQGARWGLVAADRGLQPSVVLNHYQEALGRAPTSSSAALPNLTKPTTKPGGGKGTGPRVTTTTRPGGGGPGTTTSTTRLPRIDTPIDPIDNNVDSIERILEGLLSRLPGIGGQNSSGSSSGRGGGLLPSLFVRR